ncbi:hypothetical protein FRB99_007005 [Tulasnella sp. 403]|nr:hypothetical protein FRB99_007005 [Tulasnella sp. 403]
MTRHLIVGAGVFGLSTAYHLLKEGETDVTVIDKAEVLPAPDGASNDINRIVRSAYGHPLYTSLALDAIDIFKREFPGVYYESGVVILGSSQYLDSSLVNDKAAGASVVELPDQSAIRSIIPAQVPIGDMGGATGYINKSNGWANAGAGVSAMLQKVKDLGGKVLPGTKVSGLRFEDGNGKVLGVNLQNGGEVEADIVILATGSWTPSTFGTYCRGITDRLTATGQSIGVIQLTEDEAERYKACSRHTDTPVIFNFDTGFYCFPPNHDRFFKVAIHDGGYLHFDDVNSNVSTPRTFSSHGQEGLRIPLAMAEKLRAAMLQIYPELDRSFCKTRLCWYSDTADGDWLIDQHPDHLNLYIATGDSGHAYKVNTTQ